MAVVFFSLGSNLGDRLHNLKQAAARIREQVGKIISVSDIYETEPWGYESRNKFLNQAVAVESMLAPELVMKTIHAIETEMGRMRGPEKFGDRSIDIDLLLYDDRIIFTCALNVPHPQMHQRMFVLKPLSEIAGETRHPVYNKTIAELLAGCTDDTGIELYTQGS